jgi:hypothetical protein
MSRNPYAPPGATVADPPSPPIQRPPAINRGLQLLWASFSLGLIASFIHQGESNLLEWIISLVFIGLYSALVAWLLYKIGRRRNWARIVYLVLAVISYLMIAFDWRSSVESYRAHPSTIVLDFAGMVTEICALYLLFSRPGSTWFKARSEA